MLVIYCNIIKPMIYYYTYYYILQMHMYILCSIDLLMPCKEREITRFLLMTKIGLIQYFPGQKEKMQVYAVQRTFHFDETTSFPLELYIHIYPFPSILMFKSSSNIEQSEISKNYHPFPGGGSEPVFLQKVIVRVQLISVIRFLKHSF